MIGPRAQPITICIIPLISKVIDEPGSGEGCSNITSGTPLAHVKKVASKEVLQMHGVTYRNRV